MACFCFVFGEQSPMQFGWWHVVVSFFKVEDSISFPCTLFDEQITSSMQLMTTTQTHTYVQIDHQSYSWQLATLF